MAKGHTLRLRAIELLAFDLAVCATIEPGGVSTSRGADLSLDRLSSDVGRQEPRPDRGSGPFAVAGFDEAGRGALAGPVTVACVHFDLRGATGVQALVDVLSGVDDSKRLSPKTRERLAERIAAVGRWSVAHAAAVEIDRLGIVPACRLAATRAYRGLGQAVDIGLFDRGLSLNPGSNGSAGSEAMLREFAFTRGDARSFHVAAASILAKVSRDAVMHHLETAFPGHGFAKHKGYGTADHRAAIVRDGPTPVHRRSFLRGLWSAENQSC